MKIENKEMNKIPELKIGDGKLLKKLEIKLGWKRFNIIIRW